jgi:hypothetical protein
LNKSIKKSYYLISLDNNNDELVQLKKEFDALKANSLLSNTEPKSTFIIPPQRFRPMETNNLTTKTVASVFQDPLNKLNNLTKEMKPQPVAGAYDTNTNLSTSTINNQQQQQNVNNDKNQLEVGQNVPPPPLANNAQRQQQPDHIESAQAAPKLPENNQAQIDNLQYQNKLQSSLNNSLSDNANGKLSDMNEHNDEAELNFDNENSLRRNNVEGDNALVDAPGIVKSKKKNYRTRDRERFRKDKNNLQQKQRLDNGEELDANEDNDGYQQIRKKSVL